MTGIVTRAKKKPRGFRRGASTSKRRLDLDDVFGLETLIPTNHFEFHAVPFVQGLVAIRLNGRMVNEYILTTILGDKTKTFFIFKPLHGTLRHCLKPRLYSKNLTASVEARRPFTDGTILQDLSEISDKSASSKVIYDENTHFHARRRVRLMLSQLAWVVVARWYSRILAFSESRYFLFSVIFRTSAYQAARWSA
jgi:hypothetical protein